jgi:hypothetical protein
MSSPTRSPSDIFLCMGHPVVCDVLKLRVLVLRQHYLYRLHVPALFIKPSPDLIYITIYRYRKRLYTFLYIKPMYLYIRPDYGLIQCAETCSL